MKDRYSREINYLKISLTDKCNLRCVYCNDKDESFKEYIEDGLTVDDYKFIIKYCSELGIDKIKFIGGEPLLYPYLNELIRFAKYECNIKDISITTNGQNFCEKALELKESGLDSVNISIDSLKEFKYSAITRGGSLTHVLNAFNTCLRLKIGVKINCVLINDFNTDEVYDFITLAKYNPVDIRFIELTPWGKNKELFKSSYVNTTKLIESLDEVASNDYVEESSTKYYRMNNLRGRVGIISPISHSFCENCNKIIITHDGFLRLCLYADEEIDLKKFLNKPIMFKEMIKEIIYKEKPKAYTFI